AAPPAKQVVSCFRHYHFSEHEKLQCLQLAKARTITCTLCAQVTAFNEVSHEFSTAMRFEKCKRSP
ncbi:MAG: hypothetical protein E7K27_16700, partial [[Clostridium] symbiosum]|nr:hypothetical protein [[Clostridium] symbiosum]